VDAPDAAPVVGVVLAGGDSRRFGSPKGLARVGGERMIDRVVRALQTVSSDIMLVANDPAAGDWLPGVTVVRDLVPGAGGLSGVHAALTAANRPVVVVAWDMPFASGALLRELARRCRQTSAAAGVPESDSPVGMEPFCACYTPACLPALDATVRAGRPGGAAFVRSLERVAWLSLDAARAFGNPEQLYFSVNTPRDLVRAEAMCGRSV
jgi:molybdopterin-guanine dinucleotide biosynthesis protein A